MPDEKKTFKTANLREFYEGKPLNENIIEKNPFKLFEEWFDEAVRKNILEPNAMTLATADSEGRPSARIVLLKDFDEKGFVFFTNYDSRKGKQIAENNSAALVFWWGDIARQIRIEGMAEKISEDKSDHYFNSRPRGSQLGAFVSKQSEKIPDYASLEKEFDRVSKKYKDQKIPRPANWGGYRVKPVVFEFWQGRENRLHDRLRFTKSNTDTWKLERLSP